MRDSLNCINVHSPTRSYSIIHTSTQDSLETLYAVLSTKENSSVGPGWLKYEYQGSIFNLDDDSDYSIFAWRQQQPQPPLSTDPNTPADSTLTNPSSETPTIHLHDPSNPLPTPPDYCNPSYYIFKHSHSNSRAHSTGGSSHKRTIRSTKSHRTKQSKHDHNKTQVPAFKQEFDKFHEENGVRTVMGSIGPVKNVRFLLKSGYRHVYMSRKFAKEHGFIPPDAAPGHYGYGGLVSIGTWPIALTPSSTFIESTASPLILQHSPVSTPSQLIGPSRHPTIKTHGAAALRAATHRLEKSSSSPKLTSKVVEMPIYLSEEPHFSVVLGRSFFEKRQIRISTIDPTDVICMDVDERLETELVVLKDGRGSIVTVT